MISLDSILQIPIRQSESAVVITDEGGSTDLGQDSEHLCNSIHDDPDILSAYVHDYDSIVISLLGDGQHEVLSKIDNGNDLAVMGGLTFRQ